MVDGDKSQRVGRIGQNLIEQLAVRADLLCSQIVPDDLGVDCLVAFPLDKQPNPNRPFDAAAAQVNIQVQVKTTTNDRPVSVALSALVPLKDNLGPAIICIVRCHAETLEIESMSFVHLVDKHLERLLSKLRKAAAGKKPLNKVFITFSLEDSVPIDLTPEAFKQTLADLPGIGGMRGYAERKADQLDNLGYGPDRHKAKFVVSFRDEDELTDYALGITAVQVLSAEFTETRFGLELPHPATATEADAATMIAVDPEILDAGDLLWEAPDTAEAINIPAAVAMVRAGDLVKVRVFLPLMELRSRSLPSRKVHMIVAPEEVLSKPHSTADWFAFHRVFESFRSAKPYKISFKGNEGRVTLDWISGDYDHTPQEVPPMSRIMGMVGALQKRADAISDVELNDIWKQRFHVLGADAFFKADPALLPLFMAVTEGEPFVGPVVWGAIFQMGKQWFGLAAEATMVFSTEPIARLPGTPDFKISNAVSYRPLDLRTVKDSSEATLRTFLERIGAMVGVDRFHAIDAEHLGGQFAFYVGDRTKNAE